jgi:phospholipase/carboxylesterase
VGISGWVFEQEKLLQEITPIGRKQRLLCTHGPYDTVIPIDGVREQVKEFQAAGLLVEWREFPKAHSIHGAEELAVIREFVRAGYSSR